MKATLALALTLVALACARIAQLRMPQVEDSSLVEQQGTLGAEVLRFHVGMQIELLEAGLRLRRAGRELCEEQLAPILGILAWRRNDLRLRHLKERGESGLNLGVFGFGTESVCLDGVFFENFERVGEISDLVFPFGMFNGDHAFAVGQFTHADGNFPQRFAEAA